jgi:hypothetical protein
MEEPPFEPPPSHPFNQEERTEEESVEVREVDEESSDVREEESTSGVEDEVGETLLERSSIPISVSTVTQEEKFPFQIWPIKIQPLDFLFHGTEEIDVEQHWFTMKKSGL